MNRYSGKNVLGVGRWVLFSCFVSVWWVPGPWASFTFNPHPPPPLPPNNPIIYQNTQAFQDPPPYAHHRHVCRGKECLGRAGLCRRLYSPPPSPSIVSASNHPPHHTQTHRQEARARGPTYAQPLPRHRHTCALEEDSPSSSSSKAFPPVLLPIRRRAVLPSSCWPCSRYVRVPCPTHTHPYHRP